MIEYVVRMVIALIVIAPLAWLVTTWVANKSAVSQSQRSMKIVEAVALGANKKIVLIEVAGRLLVVGVSQRDVRLLTELPAQAQAVEQKGGREGLEREETSD